MPLSLPDAPGQAATVSESLAEFARTYVGKKQLALLDVSGAGAAHRRAIESAIGADRCVTFDTGLPYLRENYRWEIVESGPLSSPRFTMAVALGPASSYVSALRTVHERCPNRPVVVLPYAAGQRPAGGYPAVMRADLGDDTPIVFILYPSCGSNRLRPVIGGLMGWFEKRRIRTVAPNPHRRFLASVDAPTFAFGDYSGLRAALDEAYFRSLDLMDLDCWTEVHDHVSAAMLARLGFAKVVALRRDPRDCAVSLYFWFCDSIHGDRFRPLTELPKEEALLALFDGFATKTTAGDSVYQVPPLEKIASDFVALHHHPHILPVTYEEARTDPRPMYRRMISWLGLDDVVFKDLSDEALDRAIALGSFSAQSGGTHQEGRTDTYHRTPSGTSTGLRKGIIGDWKNHFTPRLIERTKELIGNQLIELGYEKSLDW
jgi:hypothetical protein